MADLASSTVEAARTRFAEHFDAAPNAPAAVYQQAPLAVQADHTHYSEGFALFAALPHGVAVAAQPADRDVSRLVAPNAPARVALPAEASGHPSDSLTVRVVQTLLSIMPDAVPALDIAVANSLPSTCRDAYSAALARALHRIVVQQHDDSSPPFDRSFVEMAHAALPKAHGHPYSRAYPLAVSSAAHQEGRLASFVLVDTPAGDALPVPSAYGDAVQWGFFAARASTQSPPDASEQRMQRAQEALRALQATDDFANLQAFSDLEHRALDRALQQVDAEHQPIVRHLVTENRRVQKHVMALRHGDGQMSGALLHMTHASLQSTWSGVSPAARFLVDHAQGYTEDGLYGAGMTGRDGYVLTVGRRPAYHAHVHTLRERYQAAFHHPVSFVPL